jgi:filamentous hemagglutinin family protein
VIRRRRRKLVFGGIALAALGLAVLHARAAHAAGTLTQGYSSAIAPVASSVTANLAAAQQAQAVAVQAQDQLARVTAALQAMQSLQSTAHGLAAAAASTVPEGLSPGGLVPDSGLAATGTANPVIDWTGAQTPTQTTMAGATNVNINQTAAQAILSWNSFNVSPRTTVNFNQQGNANWVALNKIAPSGSPSQILGSIKASGQVYLINQNGIIFGGASQIDVGSLIASSADPSASSFPFNTAGIYSTPTSFGHAGGAIIVAPGAEISTSAPVSVTKGGGYVLLLGTTVQNAGDISTPDGQTELAAGDDFVLRQGAGTSNGNTTSTTDGNEIAVELKQPGSSLTGGSGLVSNTGLITADTGDITLAGETVAQNGVLLATTSTAQRGTIHLLSSAGDPDSSVTLGASGYTLVEPDLSSTSTELDSQRAALLASSAAADALRGQQVAPPFDDLSLLPDQQDESRIEIVTGGSVEFQDGSDTSAPGGQLAISATQRIQADAGAILDASGSYGVPMAMASNDIAVSIQSFELRDDPQNRLTDNLLSTTVNVDARDLSLVPASSAYASDRDYTAGGLLEVSGYLANIGHTIGEYTALGGSIEFSTGADGAIVADSGAVFDINGGTLNYQGGELAQSYLLGTNGHLYNVNDAPADITYAGVYDGFTVDHANWNVTQVYANALTAPSEIYQAGYTEGRAAGSLTLSSPTTVFDGTIEAEAVNGKLQIQADPAGVADPYELTQNEVAAPGSLLIGTLNGANLFPADTDVSFGASAPQAGGLATPVASDLTGTTILSAAALTSAGLGGLSVITDGSVDVAAPLTLAAGANISLLGSSVDIGADLTAPGGGVSAGQIAEAGGSQITLENPNPPAGGAATGDTVLAPDATISTAGLWTNLLLDPALTFTQAFINGGAVSLGSVNNVTLGAGSLIDTSSGGLITQTGGQKGGSGGAIALAAATPSAAIPQPIGDLTLGGALDAVGVSKGGALTLSAPSFEISSSAPASADPAVVTLAPKFFQQGFSAYNLQATGNIAVAPGTAINVTEPTYQFSGASAQAATGAAPAGVLSVALDPLYATNSGFTAITQRPGASFGAAIVLTEGTNGTATGPDAPVLSVGAGAAITVDPGQAISLAATGQITIDGALTAPGGAIAAVSDFNTFAALPGGPGTISIFLGPDSVLDANAAPVSFSGAGHTISLAPAGGKITLGSNGSTASVIINAGALVEASGSAAADRIPAVDFAAGASALAAGQAIPVEGAGGAITLASQEGIFNDGTLNAASGGPDAAGGTLSETLEADQVVNAQNDELTPRLFTITQNDQGPVVPAGLQPGESGTLVAGTAQISAQQIISGGFGGVTLFSRDAFVFQGDVTLSAGQSISFEEGFLTDSSASGSVTLIAPYVSLSGSTPETNSHQTPLAVISGFSAQTASGVFTVNAGEIDIANAVRFGGLLPASENTPATDLAGFATVALNSAGDLRFDAPLTSDSAALTNLVTTANLDLTAREIYALGSSSSVQGTTALVVAGYDPTPSAASGGFNPNGSLTIAATPGSTPVTPDTLGGSLTFEAAHVNQDGVVMQPLGHLTFGGINEFIGDNIPGGGDPQTAVTFGPGSITSVSAAGLTIPFGGTTDGVNYDINRQAVTIASASSFGLPAVNNALGPGTVTIAAQTTDVQEGAVLNLSGGGTLAGAGFISGQSGSSDVLTTPLLQDSGSSVTQPTLSADPVYAIVAGAQPETAAEYTQTGADGAVPSLGASVVIPAGVPGLPAGTYTLLPAYYALSPGGYRVEIDGAAGLTAAAVSALPNGSYAVAGYSALAGTSVRASLPSDLTITPGATVQNYAEYDQESFDQFLVATAARTGGIRPVLEIDAGTLVLNVPASSEVSLTNAGTTLFAAAAGGIGGTLQISGAAFATAPNLDIFGAAPVAGLPAGAVSLGAAQIDAFDAATIELGAAGKGFQANTNSVTLENGADLTAARVLITATAGGITLNAGSEIDTLGQGTLLADSTNFGLFSNGGASVLDVGNGYLSYSTTPATEADYGPITVANGATIYSGGSIAFSTAAAVNIGVGAVYGAKYLDLDVPEINVGDPAVLGVTAPAGLLLTPSVLQTLTQGNPALGVPAAQILVLTATDSLNFFGTTQLDLTGSGVQLVINTPAIYGYGTASDVATIAAGTITWNGVSTINPVTNVEQSSLPGGQVATAPDIGFGTLDLDAQTIVLGYSDLDEPLRDVPLDRLAAGFSTVDLNAATAITANNQGSLAVYQSVPDFGQAGIGGTLNLNTPLLTAAPEAVIGFTAGGDVNVLPVAGIAAAHNLASPAAGGEIDLTGQNVDIEGAVILPSGKLNLQAAQNISFGAASLVDLAGETTTNVNQNVDGFGGDLIADSANGDVTQDAGSVIDVGAAQNRAGSVSIAATAAAAGDVSLLGTLTGGADAGYSSGSFSVSAQSVGDFTALNNSLDAGGFFQARNFDIQQGDLVIGDGVQARHVNVSVDNGSLTVTGLIDASFGGGGAISLAASQNLTIAGTAVLDAQGTELVVDSYGVPIPSANAPQISLTTSTGELTLASGAQLNLASADGVARGDLELNVPRLTSPTSGDADISAATGLDIAGAATIAVNAFWTYNGAADPNDSNDALITQAYLDQINTSDTQPFMAAAATNADLAARVAGLSDFGSAYHFRPGVAIVSATADGDLTVEGDINLLAYRYGAGVVAGQAGTGEPGVLEIRAGGNLNVYGSITDGFEDPIDDSGTEFAKGWVVFGGGEPYGQNQVIPIAAEIAAGSALSSTAPVNFAVPITGGSFQAGAVAPVALTLQGAQTTSVAFVATSAITDSSGKTLFAQGAVVPAGTKLPDGAVIAAGGSLPFAVNVGKVTWPANTPFTVTTSLANGETGVVLASKLTLAAGAFIPGGSALTFVKGQPGLVTKDGVQMLLSRAVDADGSQGQLYGLAAQLPAGDLSWSINLVAGADTAAADPDTLNAASALGDGGNLILADTHYGLTSSFGSETAVPAFSVVRTGTGSLTLAAGGMIDEDSSFGVYTAGAQSAPILEDGQNPYNLAQGFGAKTSLLGPKNAAEAALVANYAAYYPTGGGNVLIDAQGGLNGYILTGATFDGAPEGLTDTDAEGNWLWRQGGAGQPGAWWIEYGSLNLAGGSTTVQYTGFQGFGTLGGGNLTVAAGGDASGLNLVVASNGRVTPDGTLVQNGGGELDVDIGGAVNFLPPGSSTPYVLDSGGLISDLRGDTVFDAGSIGTVTPVFGVVNGNDPRFLPPLDSETADLGNGIDLLPGDGTVTVDSRGDLVIDGAGDPGTVQNQTNTTPVDDPAQKLDLAGGGNTDFSLWTSATGLDLFSAGGDVVPAEGHGVFSAGVVDASTGFEPNAETNFYYPPSLLVTSQSGSIYFGSTPVELAPSADGQLQLLAAVSIIGDGSIVSISGAALSTVATPFNPGSNVFDFDQVLKYTNYFSSTPGPGLDFGLDTPTAALHEGDARPALVYAGGGDILNIEFGEFEAASGTVGQQVLAAKPFDIVAGRDIVDSGTTASPDVFLNLAATDITSVTAGRDIIESSFDIAGPGNLAVQAGRNIYLADQGTIYSIGPVFGINPNDRDSGAAISVLAGVGEAGPDYSNFANLYLNPASTLGLPDTSAIVQGDDAALYAWLQKYFGYAGDAAGAYADLLTLSAAQQDVFLRELYFVELNDSGLEFNESSSAHYKSYILGQDAIAALFPTATPAGQAIAYTGDLTMYGGSGIHTEFGGNIETFTPGGQTIIGVEGTSPPASAGFITQGSGDIDIYSDASVLLGESRVLTTFGGNIVIWSASGNINAGRGSKTSIDYTPLQRVYDNFGDVFLSPTVPSSGAGIATLNPIPAIPPGDINLIAPQGTVDAGEAGIRVSGNLNIAAAHVLNTANIQVQGTSTGATTTTAPDVGALSTAGNASGAAAQAAENATAKPQAAPLPSIWIVEILGYSGGQTPPEKQKSKAERQQKA